MPQPIRPGQIGGRTVSPTATPTSRHANFMPSTTDTALSERNAARCRPTAIFSRSSSLSGISPPRLAARRLTPLFIPAPTRLSAPASRLPPTASRTRRVMRRRSMKTLIRKNVTPATASSAVSTMAELEVIAGHSG